MINPGLTIESLIPDFSGRHDLIQMIIDEAPEVISHNIETVRRLTPLIRSKAKYETSLDVIRYVSGKGLRAKSGFMVGLGETEEEVEEAMVDLYEAGCRILTVGQYLQPSLDHMEVSEYVTPEKFEKYRKKATETGFLFVECNPLVRSSFHAEKHIATL